MERTLPKEHRLQLCDRCIRGCPVLHDTCLGCGAGYQKDWEQSLRNKSREILGLDVR